MAAVVRRKMVFVAGMIIMAVMVQGCATVRHTVPAGLAEKAIIPGMPEIRGYASSDDSPIQRSLVESLKQEGKDDYIVSADGKKIYPILAISGGSANGAYGAGMLKGWTKHGDRPVFKIVTGVSTGAITAPLAFLGPEYDSLLEEIYTTVSTKDVMKAKGPFQILLGNSLASNKRLEKYIRRIATPEILKKIADAHMHGRRLFVGSANLDAQKFVIWDMGAIALRGDEKLFEDVIIASSSIPVAFPPKIFYVEADGKKYDEMHVDGGTITQVFGIFGASRFLGPAVVKAGIDPARIKAKNYIIRNGYISSRHESVKNSLAAIATRSMDTMIDCQALGDLYRMFAHAKQRGTDYNLAYIPADFQPKNREMFDKVEMKKMFDRGYEDALKGYDWHKTPPGWTQTESKDSGDEMVD